MARFHLLPWVLLLVGSIGLAHRPASAQCANDNTYWQTTTPACPGTTVASTCLFGGEYQLINVVAGNTYTFSTCGTTFFDTEITLYNNAGGPALGYNDDGCGAQSTVTWTATFTGQLRVLIDAWPCSSNTSCATLTVGCTAGGPPPTGDCVYVLTLNDSFGDGWGTSSVGVSINGGAYTYYTVTGSTNTVLIGVNIGNIITLNYNNSGTWQGENSYSLSLQGGGSFFNSGTPPAAGVSFTQTVTCQPPPTAPQDCAGGVTICSGQAFNNNSNNTGNVVDLNAGNQGCLALGERQGTWYYFSPSTAGTIGFTIAPAAVTDYDFAVWGPMSTVTCPPAGPPLRCSYAAPTGPTGAGNGATDASEGAGGDRWVSTFNVLAGQIYIMYVDNFSSDGQAFNLSWQLTNGASLDCTILPVGDVALTARPVMRSVELDWSTVHEEGSSHFQVEHATNGVDFRPIGIVPANGHSSELSSYAFTHTDPHHGQNFYRLTAFGSNGSTHHTQVVTAYMETGGAATVVPNPVNDAATVHVDLPHDGTFQARVLDGRGRAVREWRLAGQVGANSFPLSIAGLDAGAYQLLVQDTEGRSIARGRFMKQ